MILLGLDAATSACSAALWRAGVIAAHRFEAMQRGHIERLLPMIEEVMREAGVGYGELDAVAVTVGPGSFTGLRAGLAAARGIARARDVPLLGFTTLEVVASAAAPRMGDGPDDRGGTLAVALQTGRADIYLQCFSRLPAPLTDPACISPENAVDCTPPGPVLAAGDAAAGLCKALAGAGREAKTISGPTAPDAADLVSLAAAGIVGRKGRVATGRPVRPVYLHPPHATLPRDRGKLRG